MSSQNGNAHRARKTQTMKKNKRKISLFNERNFALVDYTDMKKQNKRKESIFGQRNFVQSYYVSEQKNKRKRTSFWTAQF